MALRKILYVTVQILSLWTSSLMAREFQNVEERRQFQRDLLLLRGLGYVTWSAAGIQAGPVGASLAGGATWNATWIAVRDAGGYIAAGAALKGAWDVAEHEALQAARYQMDISDEEQGDGRDRVVAAIWRAVTLKLAQVRSEINAKVTNQVLDDQGAFDSDEVVGRLRAAYTPSSLRYDATPDTGFL